MSVAIIALFIDCFYFQVNGVNLVGMAHQKAVQIIRSAATKGTFVVRRVSWVKQPIILIEKESMQ